MTAATFDLSARMKSPQFIYLYDTGVSLLMAIVLAAWGGSIADLVGWSAAGGFLVAVGAFLFPWALVNYAIGSARAPAWPAVVINIAGDGTWAVVSAVLLAMHWNQFNTVGHVLVIVQALFVVGVFVTKLRGASAFRN